ncbi:MAG: transposase [Pseudomonadota bacterium]
MAHISGVDRSQLMLLPEAIEDYVGSDNPVGFIDAFVDQLDLAGLGFVCAEAKETGRPGYHPADLLRLYIFGYLNRICSSRRLEAETHRSIEVICLLLRLRPDFKTVAGFQRENQSAFREFVALCRDLDLFRRQLIAIDGRRIKAVNSRERNFTKVRLDKALAESEARLARCLEVLDADDEDGPCAGSVDRLQEKIVAIRGCRERLEGYAKAL